MEKYKCNKVVLATPMNRGEYNTYQGWLLPENENPDDTGFLIEYLDSPGGNHPDHGHYISWSPSEVFESGYDKVGSFKDRLTLERDELSVKVEALDKFLDGSMPPNMGIDVWELMGAQYKVMAEYLRLLDERMGML